jgi:hypothetical protein
MVGEKGFNIRGIYFMANYDGFGEVCYVTLG